jgi:integrase
LASFVAHIPPKLTIDKLKPLHVNAWLEDKYAEAGGSYQNSAVRSVKRVCNWAVKQGEIAASPLLNIESPQPESRVVYLSAAEWGKTVAAVDRDDPFFDFVMFMYETGCRPQEARAIEGRHFDRAGEQIVFPIKESKGKKVSRVIPLNDEALGIIRRLALKYPGKDDRLFRNRRGNPWKAFAITCRFGKLRKKLGFPLFAYAIRHTFITDALMRRVDPATLACIVGHKDATMILKVYGHVNLNKGHVRAALAQATGEAPARKAEIA